MIALFSVAYFERERYTTEEWSSSVLHVPGMMPDRLVPVRVEEVPAEKIPAVLRAGAGLGGADVAARPGTLPGRVSLAGRVSLSWPCMMVDYRR